MATGECWKPVIGLEIHLRLDVRSKMFSSEPVTFNESPNTIKTEVTLAESGALPGINKAAVDAALKLALSFNSSIAEKLVFDRKNYFYPDLPKGYQITQYRYPLALDGRVALASGETIWLDSLHLEEDSAKSTQLTQTERLKNGEQKLIGFFIGQIMKKIPQKTDPRIIRKRLIQSLEQLNDSEEK